MPDGARVLDVGCGRIGLRALEPDLDITGVDLAARPEYPGPFVQADASAGLPFADGEFELVHCSSVIEHVPPARRAAFAAEIRRVGRGWFVQTPAWSFPIEPHALLPFAHWLPVRLRRRYWRLGATAERPSSSPRSVPTGRRRPSGLGRSRRAGSACDRHKTLPEASGAGPGLLNRRVD